MKHWKKRRVRRQEVSESKIEVFRRWKKKNIKNKSVIFVIVVFINK